MYEKYSQPIISRRAFAIRVGRQALWALLFIAVSLAIGMAGYAYFGHLAPVDAFLNAAMILGGMGPVDPLHDDAAKVFAGLYAIYCGVVFLVIAGLILAPFLHRVLHRLHIDTSGDGPAQ
jgi:uncharacterized membrane protein